MNPILTAKVGTNADLFPDILKLYVPEGSDILDMTYGKGVFWEKVGQQKYNIWANDIDLEAGSFHYNLAAFPDKWSGWFDAVVLDPPYIFGAGGKLKDTYHSRYKNNDIIGSQVGVDKIISLYVDGMVEAVRLLKPKGILIVKCMDLISSGKQRRHHIKLWDIATNTMNLLDEDLFVLVQDHAPVMRHKYQLHARKNNSYFWIFRKKI